MKNRGNLFIILIALVILITTAWSVYSSYSRAEKNTAQQTVSAVEPQQEQKIGFFEKQYSDRLKEEGIRTDKVEKMIKEKKLSDKRARYAR